MYLAMLTLPLLGSIFSGFFGRKVGVSGTKFTTFPLLLHSLLTIGSAFYKSNIAINNALSSTVLTFLYILCIYMPVEWFNIVSILNIKLYLC